MAYLVGGYSSVLPKFTDNSVVSKISFNIYNFVAVAPFVCISSSNERCWCFTSRLCLEGLTWVNWSPNPPIYHLEVWPDLLNGSGKGRK